MASTIAAGTTSGTAIAIAGDTSGVLQLQTNGTTAAVTIDTNQRAAFVAGTAALPAITTTGDTNTGIFFPAADTIAFTEGGAEAMRIDSSGNLLVGTATALAGERLNLYGNSTTSQPALVCDKSAAGAVGCNQILFNNNNGFVGSVTTSGSTTGFNTSSDYRLKENIAPMTGALTTVSLLKPVTYKWKVDGSDGQGFIAHELAEVVPDAVTGEKDAVDAEGNIKPQGVDTSFLVATLTAAIQELNAKVDAQAVRIAELEGAK
jgi:hypothetical protein